MVRLAIWIDSLPPDPTTAAAAQQQSDPSPLSKPREARNAELVHSAASKSATNLSCNHVLSSTQFSKLPSHTISAEMALIITARCRLPLLGSSLPIPQPHISANPSLLPNPLQNPHDASTEITRGDHTPLYMRGLRDTAKISSRPAQAVRQVQNHTLLLSDVPSLGLAGTQGAMWSHRISYAYHRRARV